MEAMTNIETRELASTALDARIGSTVSDTINNVAITVTKTATSFKVRSDQGTLTLPRTRTTRRSRTENALRIERAIESLTS